MSTGTTAQRVEWPTVAVAAVVYALWLGLILTWSSWPPGVAIVTVGFVLAWHGSLQHEAIHGHPFRVRRWGDRLAAVPLSLWLPYRVYRATHLAHHRSGRLTDPYDDPESWYVSGARWRELGAGRRALLSVNRTLGGRMLIGPVVIVTRFIRGEARRLVRGDRGAGEVWTRHLVAAALVATGLVVVGVPLWQYLVACYLGVSLTLLRSYAEHRAVGSHATASAVVEAGPVMALLFLNNNLHHTHHARPGASWYRLPRLARTLQSADVAALGAGRYRGYTDVVRRHLLRPVDGPVHPSS